MRFFILLSKKGSWWYELTLDLGMNHSVFPDCLCITCIHFSLFSSVWLRLSTVPTRQVLSWLLTILRSYIQCNFKLSPKCCCLFTLFPFLSLWAIVSLLPLWLCNTWYSEHSVSIVAPWLHRKTIHRLRIAQVHWYKVLPSLSFSGGVSACQSSTLLLGVLPLPPFFIFFDLEYHTTEWFSLVVLNVYTRPQD